METTLNKKIMFFGCPMDCDEKYDSIQEKLHALKTDQMFDDPLEGVMASLDPGIPKNRWENLGSLPIPSWLGARPKALDHPDINTENFISFIDSNGCRDVADKAGQFAAERILPHIPCMVGIDHSLTGGVYSAMARHYGVFIGSELCAGGNWLH